MARVAQLIEENVSCDFVDINMGCPIDLIYKQGNHHVTPCQKDKNNIYMLILKIQDLCENG